MNELKVVAPWLVKGVSWIATATGVSYLWDYVTGDNLAPGAGKDVGSSSNVSLPSTLSSLFSSPLVIIVVLLLLLRRR